MPIPYQNIGPVGGNFALDFKNLEDKSVIITGGSSGLGLAYVKAFLDAGSFVTNADIVPLSDEALKSHKNYQFLKCDVRSWAEQLAIFKAAKQNSPCKSIDIVVANAGVAGFDPIFHIEEGEEPTEPDLKILNINLIGVIYTAKLAMHYFNQQRDDPKRDRCLILKSSLAGYMDLHGMPLYQASKYGVRGLMHNLRRLDYLRVCVIAPWFIATPLLSEKAIETLTQRFKGLGLDWALAEDSAKAVLKVAADPNINGRALAIVPRTMSKEGFLDLEHDDYELGSILHTLQAGALDTNHSIK